MATGAASAYFWYRSARVEITPLWARLNQIEPVNGQAQIQWTIAIIEAGTESARLNKIAALLTGLTTLLSATATLVGSLS